MISIKKTVAVCASAVGIAIGSAVFVPGTASAATYGGQCGAGYKVIDTHDLESGTMFLTFNGEKNCAVTVRDKPGARIPMAAGVRLSGDTDSSSKVIDIGDYTEFAGPRYVSAKGKCIDWSGGIEDDAWQQLNIHCD